MDTTETEMKCTECEGSGYEDETDFLDGPPNHCPECGGDGWLTIVDNCALEGATSG